MRSVILMLVLTVVTAGCDGGVPHSATSSEGQASSQVEKFKQLLAGGNFDAAARLIGNDARFEDFDENTVILTAPSFDGSCTSTIRADRRVWSSRFAQGELIPTTLVGQDDAGDRRGYYLATDVMCDPLVVLVRLAEEDGTVRVFIDPLNDKRAFQLE